MKKCHAFYPITGSRSAWLPCVQKAEAGSAFCKKHGDAIVGVMLGALVFAPALNEVEHLCAQNRPCPIAQAQRSK